MCFNVLFNENKLHRGGNLLRLHDNIACHSMLESFSCWLLLLAFRFSAVVDECRLPLRVIESSWELSVGESWGGEKSLSSASNSIERTGRTKRRTKWAGELLAVRLASLTRSSRRFKSNKKRIRMQFTSPLDTQHHIYKYFNKCCVFFPLFHRSSPRALHPLSSLSLPLTRSSIYVRLFGMLDRHTLRSPQIYHNNPSISESEYRSTSKESRRSKMMASHIYLDENISYLQ